MSKELVTDQDICDVYDKCDDHNQSFYTNNIKAMKIIRDKYEKELKKYKDAIEVLAKEIQKLNKPPK